MKDLTDWERGLPLRSDEVSRFEEWAIYPYVWRLKDSKLFAKKLTVPAPIRLTKEREFPNLECAIRHAKLYQDFVEDGIYSPNTRFLVCEGEKGKPTILAIMPELQPQKPSSEIEKRKSEIIGVLTKKYGFPQNEIGRDLEFSFNYGTDEIGNIYLFDLHILRCLT